MVRPLGHQSEARVETRADGLGGLRDRVLVVALRLARHDQEVAAAEEGDEEDLERGGGNS